MKYPEFELGVQGGSGGPERTGLGIGDANPGQCRGLGLGTHLLDVHIQTGQIGQDEVGSEDDLLGQSLVGEMDVDAQLVVDGRGLARDRSRRSGRLQREALRPVAVSDADGRFLLAEEGFRPEGEHDGRRHIGSVVQQVVRVFRLKFGRVRGGTLLR